MALGNGNRTVVEIIQIATAMKRKVETRSRQKACTMMDQLNRQRDGGERRSGSRFLMRKDRKQLVWLLRHWMIELPTLWCDDFCGLDEVDSLEAGRQSKLTGPGSAASGGDERGKISKRGPGGESLL
jgi:hypothetical protein